MKDHGFELVREETIPELDTRGILYKHRTGAELLSLVNEDENKVFGINLRTPPTDSTGVAHILEHAVLCGSRKYPVKEPFVELLKGSLNTFLNAFTYPDRTCYPVASQNLRDFYNLVDVYLDAVFHPRLTPQVLQQEGWHYELEDAGDPLAYKGVVFNEMKGAYSDPEHLLLEYAQHSIFPDNTYGVESGGHPSCIPDLTYEQFEGFHRKFYHPANARVYFYGNDDPEHRLLLLEEYFKEFEPRRVDSAIAPQRPFAAPRRLVHPYAVSQEGDSDNQSMVAVNWLLEDGLDAETTMALHILDHILIGTPASPLHKALIDSGLGEEVVGAGLESELRQVYFSVGLRGVRRQRADEVEELILNTLGKLARKGIDGDLVAAAMNTAEFRLRENNTGSFPRGLALMLRSLSTWIYDRDPFAHLGFERPLNSIASRLRDGGLGFPDLIREYFLDNPHRSTLVLEPDAHLGGREEADERTRLERARSAMDPKDLEAVAAASSELRRLQETPDSPQALATLPRLQLSDLERNISTLPLEVVEQQGVRTLYHDIFTNGIVYLDVGFDLRVLPQEYLPYLPLFGRALLEMGTSREDFVKLAQRIGSRTGGIGAEVLVSAQHGKATPVGRLLLRAKAMTARAADMLDILRDVLLDVELDNKERFQQMALEEKAAKEAGLVPGGHRLVNVRLRSRFDETGWVAEQLRGVSYLFFLRRLVQEVEEDWPAVASRLGEIRRLLVNRSSMLVNITMDAADRTAFQRPFADFLAAIPAAATRHAVWKPPAHVRGGEGLAVPAQVNYVGKAANLYDAGYELHGSVGVITRYLGTTWLWDRVRVQGGAYGAFCSFDHFSGVLSYLSYRDPDLLGTLEVYDGSSRFLAELELSEDELTKAIIGAIGDLDLCQLPDAKGYTSLLRYLAGIGDEFRQQMRDEILGTTAEDFRKFAEVLRWVESKGEVVAMGAQEALEGASGQIGGGLKVVRLL